MTSGKCILAAVLFTVILPIAARSQQSSPVMAHISSATVEAREDYSRSIWGVAITGENPTTLYKVDSGNMTYTLESDGRQPVEVGHDYEVKKVARKEMVLLVPRKNKRPAEVDLHIKSASQREESNQANSKQ